MNKSWIIAALLIAVGAGLYFYTQSKDVVDAAVETTTEAASEAGASAKAAEEAAAAAKAAADEVAAAAEAAAATAAAEAAAAAETAAAETAAATEAAATAASINKLAVVVYHEVSHVVGSGMDITWNRFLSDLDFIANLVAKGKLQCVTPLDLQSASQVEAEQTN